jgi:hypothetical protein
MRPLLVEGDVVGIEPVEASRLRMGDVVAYRVDGRLLMHRFGFSTAKGLWMFDDAATVGWHRVPAEALVGRLQSSRPLTRGRTGLLYGLGISFFYGMLGLARRL